MATSEAAPERLTSPHVFLFLTALFWSGNVVVGKYAIGLGIPPIDLTFMRLLLAVLILLPFAYQAVHRDWPEVRSRLGFVILLGMLSVGTFNVLLYLALQVTTAINVTLVGALQPAITVLFSWLLLRTVLTGLQNFGLALSVAGVVLVVARGDLSSLASVEPQLGDVYMLIAVTAWCLYTVLLRRYPLAIARTTLLFWQLVVAVVMQLPLVLWETGGALAVPSSAEGLGSLLFLTIFPTLLAIHFFNLGVARGGPNLAGMYANVVPVLVAIEAVLFLGEDFRLYHALAMAMILGGVLLSARGSAH